ncbi:hypothetical protein BGX29_004390 [Mortierella sp. GBA35]|nr:hypothetical protein BGX29_004390 [Mortierella sp. GBA35]
MGVPRLWMLIRERGYEALLRYRLPLDPESSCRTKRVDILATFFSFLGRTYTYHDLSTAHTIFEQHLFARRIPKLTSVLYLDGPSPAEKRTTRELREAKRTTALQKALECINNMEERFNTGRRLRKRHFDQLYKHINAAFYWPLESRVALAQYLRANGWNVVVCESEADVAIAEDCEPGDIVISGDSDMVVYSSVGTIWRPISGGKFLVCEIADVLKHMELSRAQLTTLGVVSKNDYTSNLPRMGVATNYKIIKSLEESDVETMVQRYLDHPDLVKK